MAAYDGGLVQRFPSYPDPELIEMANRRDLALALNEYSSNMPPFFPLSFLERFPAEIKLHIFRMLPVSDLTNLMGVSSFVVDAVRHALYEAITCRVNCDDKLYMGDLFRFKKTGRGNLKLVRTFSVCNTGAPHPDSNRIQPVEIRMNHVGRWFNEAKWMNCCKRFNRLLKRTVEAMPNLREFRSNHLFPLSESTLARIFKACPNIETMQLVAVDVVVSSPDLKFVIPTKLRSIGCRGGYDMRNYYLESHGGLPLAFRKAILVNAQSVSHIVVGQECWAAQSYKQIHKYLQAPSPWNLDDCFQSLAQPGGFPQLENLEVVGYNLRMDHPRGLKTISDIFDFHALRSLTLTSCFQSEELLVSLANYKWVPRCMNLKEFTFRHEYPTDGLLMAIELFLCSFSGLEFLSLLIDNTYEMPNYDKIFRVHGPTLKGLVWEGRKRYRPGILSLESHTRGGPSFLESLRKHCREIRELSIALDLNMSYNTYATWQRIRRETPFYVLELPKLSTLHLRHAPSLNRITVDTFLIVQSNKAAVSKYLDWGNLNYDIPSKLKLVAVGPLTYSDRYLLDRPNRMRSKYGPTSPFFYDVTVRKNNLGLYDHLLVPLGKFHGDRKEFSSDNIDAIQEAYPNTRIFDSYWLK